ncbi:N-acetylmuramoyl-L-alanine amidase [Anaerosacchariphilus polymeriproducens]|uniref:N-acetylmuramoyl-L-alanine amidase n=1 Tax=Anaerosacchariphilus polymeriproducens TaxID=1812858 RepID=A0A371AWR0_9FIRM|nr:N-acetylmuramoyl-L-alanine amidase [Anaerosacchariphilus polymeriproducens]RDU24008.1 N-acetylmuramoyl-L-alanine amidase [Anaerosacchariphilus polymeriproducens]
MAKLVLDAGHGGFDTGATYNDRQEKEDNLNLALKVGEVLSNMGYEVLYTRISDIYLSPFERAQIANNSNADYFIAIHRNSYPEDNVYSGVETLVYDESGIKAEMAKKVNQELEKVGFKNLGINERPDLIVLRRSKMPSILSEVGYIDSDIDNKLFDEKFDEIADGIAKAISDTIQMGSTPIYGVQIGLFQNLGNAQFLVEQVMNQGFNAEVVYQEPFYKVWVLDGNTLDSAVELQSRLKDFGYDTLVVNR